MTRGSAGPTPQSAGYVQALIEDDPAELYETAPCGYVSTDPSGLIVKANRTFLEWTGHRASDLVHRRRFQTLLATGDRIFYETHFAPSLTMQGSVREIAVELVGPSGERLPVLLNAVLKTDDAGRPSAIRIAVFDARERRAYEQELVAARERAEQAAAAARSLAETLQRTLLPPDLPSIAGLDFGGAYRPAGDGSVVGGDFYDVFEIRSGVWGVVLGDVCGKGPSAAVVTALARHTVRALAVRMSSPSEVLAGLHDAIDRSDSDGFCTALHLVARPEDGSVHLTMSAGGHHLPLHVDRDGEITEVGRTGHLLGMLGPPRLHDVDVAIRPGESLALYTDGVVEGRRGSEYFGEQRLRDTLRAHHDRPAQALADTIAGAAVEFQDGHTRDDIAVVVLKAPAG